MPLKPRRTRYHGRIVVWCDGEIVAEHSRRFGRGQTAYDPWHYLPILARKPGALRNGDPGRKLRCLGRGRDPVRLRSTM